MQFKITSAAKLATLVIFAASTASAFAQSAGDTVVNAGWFHIMPQDSSTPLRFTSPQPGAIPGSGATAKTADTLAFSVTRFLTDNWAVVFDLGIPPTYKLNGAGSLAPVGQIGSARQWAPAVLAKYYFGDANAQWRPSLGLGLTHVNYTNIKFTDKFQQTIGGRFGDATAKTTADLESSWAPVYNAGLSYAINKDWSANLSVSYVPLKTTANLTTQTKTVGPVLSTTRLALNPIITNLSVGYRF